MRVLGIETSCDETGIAVIDSEKGLLAHELFSQIELHQIYGGVVPELASRDHVQKAIPLIDKALNDAGIRGEDLDAVAYTAGPGLMGALLVGAMLGQSLAMGWGIKAIPVHHIEAHLLATMLEDEPPAYPFVTLLVSGGHTMLMDVKSFGEYALLGQTLDDAAGEAFDKTAKIMGLEYPGGPALAAIANNGRDGQFHFPRPMLNKPNLDFSFSGLKTAVMQAYTKAEPSEQLKADVALGFEQAVVDVLITKAKKALQQTSRQRLVVAGGVAANQRLRAQLKQMDCDVYFPRSEFCTDNGAMIAYTGLARLERGLEQVDMENYVARARWPLESLSTSAISAK